MDREERERLRSGAEALGEVVLEDFRDWAPCCAEDLVRAVNAVPALLDALDKAEEHGPGIIKDRYVELRDGDLMSSSSGDERALFSGPCRGVRIRGYAIVPVERFYALRADVERITAERDALRAQLAKAEANYRFMVERAADEKLDGYRELGARAAAAENERDRLGSREDFVRAEAAAFRRFVDRHLLDDIYQPTRAHYSREYRCGCGFGTLDAGEIWDHSIECREGEHGPQCHFAFEEP
jgi:hypothetical protein